jgi:hypothetical protein
MMMMMMIIIISSSSSSINVSYWKAKGKGKVVPVLN